MRVNADLGCPCFLKQGKGELFSSPSSLRFEKPLLSDWGRKAGNIRDGQWSDRDEVGKRDAIPEPQSHWQDYWQGCNLCY